MVGWTSSHSIVLGDLRPFEVGEAQSLVHLFLRPEYLDLAYMGILATMLVLQNADLHIYCEYVILLFTVQKFGAKWHHIPPRRFLEVEELYLLEVLQMISGSNRNLIRSVRLVALEVQVDGEFLNTSFLHELDVD